MKWLLLLLLLPVAFGELWMVSNATYEFSITSEKTGLSGISFELLGECDITITTSIGNDILYEGTDTNITFESLPRNSRVSVAIANTYPDTVMVREIPYNESIFADMNPSVIIGNQVITTEVTKQVIPCSIQTGDQQVKIRYTETPGIEYLLKAEPQPIHVEVAYERSTIGAMKDLWHTHKPTLVLHLLLLVLFIVGCFYTSWHKMLEVLWITTLAYFLIMRTIAIIVPVTHVILIPTLWILTILYILTHYKKVIHYLKQ